jgi:Family of unknown function (DUF5995)
MNAERATLQTCDEDGPHHDETGKVVGSTLRAEPSPPRLGPVQTLGEVAQDIDRVIEWSIQAQSAIGYFAVLYKRVTVAIAEAIDDGLFDDGPRMEQLALAFARRYFGALNGFFYPGQHDDPSLPWEVSFVGDQRPDNQSTMLQHMMTGINAHITFDLGLSAVTIAPDSLAALENDFNRVNALLCSQIPGMLDIVEQLSPTVRTIRRLVPNEVGLLKRMLMKQRTSAWYFAVSMAINPQHARERRVNQESWSAALGAWYLQPPARLTAFPLLVRAIAKRESHDVEANILALQGTGSSPVKMAHACL